MPDVLSYNDYYPFGWALPNRSASSSNYRYGFNGMEKDDEIKGNNLSYDFGARMLDPRVGRFLSLDEYSKVFPYESNYVFTSNNPIIYKDPTGDAKILTLVYTNAETGDTFSISVTIDEDYIESKVSKINNLLVPTEYSWHDVNIIQNITIESDGTYTFGETQKVLLDPVKTTTGQNFNSEKIARAKIAFKKAFDYIDSPGRGETWSGGGIDFYSEKGEGSGIKAKDRSLIDYIDGDEMLAFIKLGKSFGKGLKGENKAPHPDIEDLKEKSKILKDIEKANKAFKKIKKYKKQLEKVIKPVFEMNNVPDVCDKCGRWYGRLDGKFIEEEDVTPEQRANARTGTTENHEPFFNGGNEPDDK